jgi:hypothetical protein
MLATKRSWRIQQLVDEVYFSLLDEYPYLSHVIRVSWKVEVMSDSGISREAIISLVVIFPFR